MQKAEGFWQHRKPGNSAVPEEVGGACRLAVAPVFDVMRLCRAFRGLP